MSVVGANDRVAVFIDAQFFLKGFLSLGVSRFDFHAVVNKLVSPGKITRAWYYDAPPPPHLSPSAISSIARQKRAVGALPFFEVEMGRMMPRTRKVYVFSSKTKEMARYYEQKGVDVKLAIDMLSKAQRDEYDTAVLVSGDSDFVDLVKLVKEIGKHVVNARCPSNHARQYHPSSRLEQACDGCIDMDAAYLRGCEMPAS